ncbi:winged helix DNA-binding protein [Picrophilus oshimae]|uniref:Winged helix DNA-binding domain-containing protein n=1 Tax=Picrophilus torridus (strain ATCC 700027 / DSM 9790 / JCM 10055 / NBRC 100828 / KAW 2/3) TaxID=1122961 RepID=Q6L1W2_PICTO|nr:winged helix DNA-binding protein [Picrophilus oshimae]AAT43040.1 hypothetical protein PTO0455 [Picrophilus oshimae DSM 9789]SMD30658.1 Winged helix DNA-binding domain-containing protein [Picrophilus oshimae DSM 9789]
MEEYTYKGSLKKVFDFIRERKVTTLCEIIENTNLSKRTVLYAIKKLEAMDLVYISICLNDARRRYYCINIA